MLLPTLESSESVKEHLTMLYPHLNNLNSKELQLFYEYLLANKVEPLPKLPNPKSLNSAESLLIVLAELYPK